MKKLFYVVFTTLCITFLLTGCTANTTPPEKTDDGGGQTTNDQISFYFDTYEELTAFFTSDKSSESVPALSDAKAGGAEYETLVNRFVEGKAKIRVPCFAGKPGPLRNQEGYFNITLFSSELYSMPWIWYYWTMKGQNVIIRTTYLSESVTEYARNHSCSEVIKSISPTAPNTDNYQSFPNYRAVYEQTLQLSDKKTSAMFYEVNDDERFYVFFIYDDILVIIVTKPDVMTSDFWSGFSLGDIT